MLDVDLELFQNLLDVGSVSSDEEMVMDVFRDRKSTRLNSSHGAEVYF